MAEGGGDSQADDGHGDVVGGPLAAGDVAVVFFVVGGVQTEELVEGGLTGAQPVASLAQHAQ